MGQAEPETEPLQKKYTYDLRCARVPDGCACGQFGEAPGENEQYKAQEAELQEQIREQKERSKEIDKFEEYVKTDDYIKDMAEDRLNLVDPNEIVFKPSE